MRLTTKGSSRMKKYRERLKSNPELYKTAKQSHAAYVKMKRSEWTEEQKQLNREQSRERMNRYREKKKQKKLLRKNSQELDRNWKNKNNNEKSGNCQSINKEKNCHLKDREE